MKEFSKYKLSGFCSFFILGTLLTALPALMPVIKEELKLSYDSLGIIFSAGSIGFFIGSLVAGITTESLGVRKNNLLGILLAMIGVFGMVFSVNAIMLCISNFVYSFGTALLEIGIPSVAKIFVKKSAGVMNLMHSLFALGAMASPIIVSILISTNTSWQVFYIIIGISLALPALIFMNSGYHINTKSGAKKIRESTQFFRMPLFWIVCITTLCYVFSELGVNSWAPTYATDSMNYAPEKASLLPSVFWGGLFIGRFVASKLVDRIGEVKWLLIVSAIGIPIVFFAQNPVMNYYFLMIFVFLSGTIHASFYPTLQSIIMDNVKSGLGFAISVFSAFGSLGGVFGGIFIGQISSAFGIKAGYSSAFYFFLITFAMISLIYIKKNQK